MKRRYTLRGTPSGVAVWNAPPLTAYSEIELVPKAEADELARLLAEANVRLERTGVADEKHFEFQDRCEAQLTDYNEERH